MFKRNTITAAVLAAIVVAQAGTVVPMVSASPAKASASQVTANQGDIALLVEQVTGSNKAKLTLDISDEYTKSISSVEVRVQLEKDKISGVSMDWNSTLKNSQCKASYNKNKGVLTLLVTAKNDLIENGVINLGTMGYKSKDSETFTSAMELTAVKAVDLQHKRKSLSVVSNRTSIEYIPVKQEAVATEKPAATNKPAATEKPAVTNKPVATNKPAVTEKPATTNKPEATVKPGTAATPAATDKAEAANKPAVSTTDSSSNTEHTTEQTTATNAPNATTSPETEETQALAEVGTENSEVVTEEGIETSTEETDEVNAEVTVEEAKEEGSSMAVIVSVVAAVLAAAGIGGYFVLKRKNNTKKDQE